MTRTVSIDRARLHEAAATAGIDRERADAVWAASLAERLPPRVQRLVPPT